MIVIINDPIPVHLLEGIPKKYILNNHLGQTVRMRFINNINEREIVPVEDMMDPSYFVISHISKRSRGNIGHFSLRRSIQIAPFDDDIDDDGVVDGKWEWFLRGITAVEAIGSAVRNKQSVAGIFLHDQRLNKKYRCFRHQKDAEFRFFEYTREWDIIREVPREEVLASAENHSLLSHNRKYLKDLGSISDNDIELFSHIDAYLNICPTIRGWGVAGLRSRTKEFYTNLAEEKGISVNRMLEVMSRGV